MTDSQYLKENFENKPHLQSCFQSAHNFGGMMDVPCSSYLSDGASQSLQYMATLEKDFSTPSGGDYFYNGENEHKSSSCTSFESQLDGSQTYGCRRSTNEKRDRINERERERMHQLCDAFERLRGVLPYKKAKKGPNRQKLSKISTLLLAQNYIKTLEDLLHSNQEYDVPQLPANHNSIGDFLGNAMLTMTTPDTYTQQNQYNYYQTQQSEHHTFPYV
ncbi:uncharacterized protein [Antedon mediterranea]|uniref:uncharacterized protein n=1 Tax=Antedon mediterranea TaxID=105859 RepID=UPI003AF4F6B6